MNEKKTQKRVMTLFSHIKKKLAGKWQTTLLAKKRIVNIQKQSLHLICKVYHV